MTIPSARDGDYQTADRSERIAYWVSRRWVPIFAIFLAVFNGLPWLAPLFMAAGWTRPANGIYLLYRGLCHQLPQRSFFLFGERLMIPVETIYSQWQMTTNPMILRQFNGTSALGWKVAWSDRMVYMYGALFLFTVAYWPLRNRLAPLSWKGLLLFLLPMGLDGLTHMVSDVVGGVAGGFRFDNEWLATLTGHTFPSTFYVGDGLGSFNAWLRLISGVLFGLGAVWFAYPHLQRAFAATVKQIETKLK